MALSGSQQYVGSGKKWSFPIAASTKIYAGALVALNADGYLIRATDTAATFFLGVATATVDNTSGNDGDLSVEVDIGGAMVLVTHTGGSLAAANKGDAVFADGDDAVDTYANATNKKRVGTIIEAPSATTCWVKCKAFGGADVNDIVALTDSTAGTANDTLQALADGSTYANDVAAIRNNFADLAAKVNEIIRKL